MNGSLKSLQVILESGHADLDVLTAERQTPLILAAAKVRKCFSRSSPAHDYCQLLQTIVEEC